MSNPTEKRLVARIKRNLKKNRVYFIHWRELEGAKVRDGEHLTDITARLAEKSGTDWLLDNASGEARFYR